MKILLDENLPHLLRTELTGHDVHTVAYMRWSGIENGELLRLAAADGFGVFVTNDRGLEYKQNLNVLPLSVVVLLAKANTIEAIRTLCPELLEVLSQIGRREFAKVPQS